MSEGIMGGHVVIKTDTPALENNNGVTQGGSGDSDSANNNGGQEDELGQFWDDVEADDPSGSSENLAAAGESSQRQQAGKTGAEMLNDAINGLSFGDGLMNQELFDDEGNMDFKAFNEGLQNRLQQAVRQTIFTMAPMLQQLQSGMQQEMETRIKTALESRDDFGALKTELPYADDPEMGPVVQGIYAQAKKRAKGDRAKAIALTNKYLQKLGHTVKPEDDVESAGGVGRVKEKPAMGDSWMTFLR